MCAMVVMQWPIMVPCTELCIFRLVKLYRAGCDHADQLQQVNSIILRIEIAVVSKVRITALLQACFSRLCTVSFAPSSCCTSHQGFTIAFIIAHLLYKYHWQMSVVKHQSLEAAVSEGMLLLLLLLLLLVGGELSACPPVDTSVKTNREEANACNSGQ